MSRLEPQKLHVRFVPGVTPEGPAAPRRYTLTHSDTTGNLFLTIGADYDRQQIAGLYTRLMRDEVLAEWVIEGEGALLNVHCHVSGGLVVGGAAMRAAIFRRELPLVLESFRHGDARLFQAQPQLDQAAIRVHFHSNDPRYNCVEDWGVPAQYRLAGEAAPE